jgi:DHA1 family inner membrane transport protein
MSLPLLALFLAAFAVGTTEFIIAGLLPEIASDLGVSIATAGLLISGYAAGVAIGGPIVAIATTRFERRATLLGLMAVFLAGNALCALSPSYAWLLAARVFIACTHGALLGIAAVMATTLVPENRQARAISMVLSGLTVSNIIGLPLGTAIGNAFGWRMTFWAIAALGVASAVGMAALLPREARSDAPKPGIMSEIAVLGRLEEYLSLLMFVAAAVAYVGLFSYVAPLLLESADLPEGALPWVLSFLGVGAFVGIIAGGRLADWKLMPSVIVILAVQVAMFCVLPFLVHNAVVATIAMFVWSATGVSLVATPLQARALKSARASPNLASTLISSAFNVGIAAGAGIGAAALMRGVATADLPWLGLLGAIPALLLAFLARALDRRQSIAAAATAA